MNKKLIESTKPPAAAGMGKEMTVQVIEDVLVLNLYQDKQLQYRYAINQEGTQYASLRDHKWGRKGLVTIASGSPFYGTTFDVEKFKIQDASQKKLLICFWNSKTVENAYRRIEHYEYQIRGEKRGRETERKRERINKMIDSLPYAPAGIERWAVREVFTERYMFFNKEKNVYQCTACGRPHHFKRKIRHNEIIRCTRTDTDVMVKKRKGTLYQSRSEQVAIINKIPGKDMMATQLWETRCTWEECRQTVECAIKPNIVMMKEPDKTTKTYFLQSSYLGYTYYWDTNAYPKQRFIYNHLYAPNIVQEVKGTPFEPVGYILQELHKKQWDLNYSIVVDQYKNIGKLEYLIKAGLKSITEDVIDRMKYWNNPLGEYWFPTRMYVMSANTIDGFLNVSMQRVNRLKKYSGGPIFLEWLQWEEKTGKKVKDSVIAFFQSAIIYTKDYEFIMNRMSPEQFANYLQKQSGMTNGEKSPLEILNDWEDYLKMSAELEYDVNDEIVYKPRDLELRHNQRVMETIEKENETAVKKIKEKYPNAEPFLKNCKSKYEYSSGTYRVIVPDTIMEIRKDGNYLKHCVASSERYYDRINRHESFIAFVRKTEEPDKPFYTLEIEPGGNIRQQRTFYNRQTGLEEIKGFLKEYQRNLKRNLTKEDRQMAQTSTRLHLSNLKMLKASKVERDKELAEILETDYMAV